MAVFCHTAPPDRLLAVENQATMHFNRQSTIALDGDRATGESYCIAHHLFTEDGERKLMVAWLRYGDTFVQVDGELVARRAQSVRRLDRNPPFASVALLPRRWSNANQARDVRSPSMHIYAAPERSPRSRCSPSSAPWSGTRWLPASGLITPCSPGSLQA